MIFPLSHHDLRSEDKGHDTRSATYEANYEPLYAPVAGTLTHFDSREGGDWVFLLGVDGKLYQFSHLSEQSPDGEYNEGDQIGVTGNSGDPRAVGIDEDEWPPFLHAQIFSSDEFLERLDPESVFPA